MTNSLHQHRNDLDDVDTSKKFNIMLFAFYSQELCSIFVPKSGPVHKTTFNKWANLNILWVIKYFILPVCFHYFGITVCNFRSNVCGFDIYFSGDYYEVITEEPETSVSASKIFKKAINHLYEIYQFWNYVVAHGSGFDWWKYWFMDWSLCHFIYRNIRFYSWHTVGAH